MRTLPLLFLTIFFLVSAPLFTNFRQTTPKVSSEVIVVENRRFSGHLVQAVNGRTQNLADALTQLSRHCQEPGQNHAIISTVDDSASVSDLFDTLKLIEDAGCNNARTVLTHDGKVYNVKLSEIKLPDF